MIRLFWLFLAWTAFTFAAVNLVFWTGIFLLDTPDSVGVSAALHMFMIGLAFALWDFLRTRVKP